MKAKPPSKSVWWLQEHDNDDHSILVPFSTRAAALKAASAVAADPRPTVTRVEVWKKTTVWEQAVTFPVERRSPSKRQPARRRTRRSRP
jgi:hypothetical protein